MQLRNKIIHLTGILMLLLGFAGGLHLWLMQNRMRQVLYKCEKQNESVFSSRNAIKIAGLELFENVSHYEVYGFPSDDSVINQMSEANQKPVQFNDSDVLYWTYFGTWLVISFLAVVLMNRFCNNVTRRISAMEMMVEKAGKGQFYVRLQDGQQDELAELARKMNGTAEYLAETRKNLEKTTRELALQLEERKIIEAKLAEAATHDSLTGLPNRASFYEQFNHAIALAERQRANIALLFLDMDGLKIVNDAFGHDGGDMLIQQVAQRLFGNIRKSDYVARLAGDEFVVILENLLNVEEDVRLVCTKLLAVLSKPYDIRGRRIKLTASIGVSLFPDHGSVADELLHKADSAMYQVKNTGKNNFSVYEMKQ